MAENSWNGWKLKKKVTGNDWKLLEMAGND